MALTKTTNNVINGAGVLTTVVAASDGTNPLPAHGVLLADGTTFFNGSVDASGTKVTAATIPTGGVGFLGWLSAIWYQLTQTITVSAASLPLPTGAAQDGTDITTPTAMPAGGAGIRGWLSAIWTKLNGSLAVTGTFWQATQPVSLAAATSGGSTPYSFLAAGGGNQDSTVIKGTPGQVYGWQLLNTSAAVRYVKVYDKATGPTSADTPVKRYFIPAGGGVVVPQPAGVAFANGISFRCTTGVADADTGACTANDVIVNCNYK